MRFMVPTLTLSRRAVEFRTADNVKHKDMRDEF